MSSLVRHLSIVFVVCLPDTRRHDRLVNWSQSQLVIVYSLKLG